MMYDALSFEVEVTMYEKEQRETDPLLDVVEPPQFSFVNFLKNLSARKLEARFHAGHRHSCICSVFYILFTVTLRETFRLCLIPIRGKQTPSFSTIHCNL
jgi:hypothetical protein